MANHRASFVTVSSPFIIAYVFLHVMMGLAFKSGQARDKHGPVAGVERFCL